MCIAYSKDQGHMGMNGYPTNSALNAMHPWQC